MRMRIGMLACALALCMGLTGCGGADSASSSTPAVTEYDFYSVSVPEGYKEGDTSNVFVETSGDGSLSVSVFNSTADELLKVELSSDSYEQGDNLTAGGRTYLTAVSKDWNTTYYITEWEGGCIEVKAKDVNDKATIEAFLDSLVPAQDAYQKWQSSR